jgi:hypothetical protein
MPKLYVVDGELWLEKTRIASETGQDVFRSDMIDDEIHEAIATILKAVSLTLENTLHLKADDTSDHSGPFTLESLESRDEQADFVGRAFATYAEADEFIKTNKIGAKNNDTYELLNCWGNTVEWPYAREETNDPSL